MEGICLPCDDPSPKRDANGFFKCPKCTGKFKRTASLTRHLADKHDVNVTWHHCDRCTDKFKHKANLTQHLADKHDVNVTWYHCDQCTDKFKQKATLTRHLIALHYNVYCQRRKQQEEHVRVALLLRGWNEWSSGDTLPPPGHFKREHQIDFTCAGASEDRKWCRIDFVLAYDDGTFVFLEVDEHQHRFGYDGEDGARLSCDSKRMANVQSSITIEFVAVGADAPPIYWLRYNPHTWHVNGTTITVGRVEREKRLCDFLSQSPSRAGIGYAFYDYDEECGLDVLSASEFHPLLRDMVENLQGLDVTTNVTV